MSEVLSFYQPEQQRRLISYTRFYSWQISACHRGFTQWWTDSHNRAAKHQVMILHIWHVFISSSLALHPQGFCRSTRRLLTWNTKPTASPYKLYWLHFCKNSGGGCFHSTPSPISSSYTSSVPATMSLLFLACQAAFLAVPQKHPLWDVTRTSCSPCLAFDCVPSPFKSTCQILICYHRKFVLCQTSFPLPFVPSFALAYPPSPSPYPSVCHTALQPSHVFPHTELMPDTHRVFKDTFQALRQAKTKMGLYPSHKAIFIN